MFRTRIAAALLAAATALTLTACTQAGDPQPAPTTTPASVRPVAAPTTTLPRGSITDSDRVFLSQLTDYWKNGIDRGKLFAAGEGACSQMRAGQKLEVIAMLSGGKIVDGSLTADGVKVGHAADFVHAAATAYCPDQLSGIN